MGSYFQKELNLKGTVLDALGNRRFCFCINFIDKALRRGIIFVGAAICAITKLNFSHSTFCNIPGSIFQHIDLRRPVATSFSKCLNLSNGGRTNLRTSRIGRISGNFALAISLRHAGLSRDNNLTAFGSNLVLVRLINIPRQCRDEQGGQNSQDNQNDDQFDEGEALFVFQFF